jgi:hypothetical protein
LSWLQVLLQDKKSEVQEHLIVASGCFQNNKSGVKERFVTVAGSLPRQKI